MVYLYWLIAGCEVAFWGILLLGLITRYLFKRKRLSNNLLLMLPVTDLVLLAITATDLKSGASATFAHGLAAAYVGLTVAFGATTVAWADKRFAHWYEGAPAPIEPPVHGWPALGHELRLWARCLVAATITLVLLAALIAFVNDDSATKALREWFRIPVAAAVLWLIFGPIWTLLFSILRRDRSA
jgi:hypothetical protein